MKPTNTTLLSSDCRLCYFFLIFLFFRKSRKRTKMFYYLFQTTHIFILCKVVNSNSGDDKVAVESNFLLMTFYFVRSRHCINFIFVCRLQIGFYRISFEIKLVKSFINSRQLQASINLYNISKKK
jgi:hypothetical protein